MKNRRPLLGLLTFSFHSLSGSLALIIFISLLIGSAAQVWGNAIALQLFPLMGAGAIPYTVLVKSGDATKWDKYLISMPITRKSLATAPYLNVFIALLLGIPIIGIVWGIGIIWGDMALDSALQFIFIDNTFVCGVILLIAALLYPLGCTKLGQRSEQGLFITCTVISSATVAAISGTLNGIGLTSGVTLLLILTITGIAFITSLFITQKMCAKADF